MKIYNTLSGKKEEFVPIEEGKVRMYVCGPTVYNLIHIGNARPMIVFDTARRYMEYKGYAVNFVSNFTDVDDKIIKKALEEGVDASVISKRYIEECKKDMDGMNVRPATTHPLATEEIDGMLEMIDTLLQKGHAYVAKDGTVYFRTRSFNEYGKLSHKNLDDLQGGNRSLLVSGEDQKEDPLDFVLWKPKKEGEPYWDSAWCQGRPGWHIECSVMSRKYLGEEIDIHAGGEDLIFPHHENEIAQSESANGKIFARYWMHNGFLNIDNKKMSKSLGNFFTVRDVAKEFEYEVIRFFMLSAHYRSPINFSKDLMESAASALGRVYTCLSTMQFLADTAEEKPLTDDEKAFLVRLDGYREKFIAAMDDDLNTADAISAIFEIVGEANKAITAESRTSKEVILSVIKEIKELGSVLGLFEKEQKEEIPAEIEALLTARAKARQEKNWADADAIRNQLKEKGYAVKDTPKGQQLTKL